MSLAAWVENYIARFDLPIVTLETRRILRGKWSFKSALIVVGLFSGVSVFLSFLCLVDGQTNTLTSLDTQTCVMLMGFVLSVIKLGILFIVLPVYASRVLVEMRETGSFTMLAMIPLKSSSIIMQYACIAFAVAVLVMLITLPATILFVMASAQFGEPPFSMPLLSIWDILIYPTAAALYVSIGVLCSCLCSKAQSATTATYIMIGVLTWLISKAPMSLFSDAFLTCSQLVQISVARAVPILLTAMLSAGLTAIAMMFSTRAFESLRRAE
ncbi:MAG: hypothetical protein ABFD83_09290 [Armatimonadota bacterium]